MGVLQRRLGTRRGVLNAPSNCAREFESHFGFALGLAFGFAFGFAFGVGFGVGGFSASQYLSQAVGYAAVIETRDTNDSPRTTTLVGFVWKSDRLTDH